ncbi:MAG: tetraacyldisaccharide 4'-kinase [Micavibrio sp.]
MPPKTPSFWREKGLWARLLWPLGMLYYCGHRVKSAFARPYQSRLPVLCVGGAVAGGSGKTPTVHALIRLLRESGLAQNPVILTRGYGGSMKGPTQVQAGYHDYCDVGDEALLHAAVAPTIIGADRGAGARLAEAMGADMIVMDDGLQNNTLMKTLSFLVLDKGYGTGNGWMIPAGPLREPLPAILGKVKGAILTGAGDKTPPLHGTPLYETQIKTISHHDKSKRYFGFAGLGRPDKFRDTLTGNNFALDGFEAFADHHPYSGGDLARLMEKAGGARLITTEKDYMRIPEEYRHAVDVLQIEMRFSDPAAIIQQIRSVMGEAR